MKPIAQFLETPSDLIPQAEFARAFYLASCYSVSFFNHIVAHIASNLHPSDVVAVANVAVWAALYANNVVLLFPNVPGLSS